MAKKIKVLLADDVEISREGLRVVLGSDISIEIVGVASSAYETQRLVFELSPDVLVIDLKWYGDTTAGWTTIKDIKSHNTKLKIIAITAYEELIKDARFAGADIAITKTFSRKEIIDHIKNVMLIDQKVLSSYDDVRKKISSREYDVLKLIAEGYSDKAISGELVIAENTTKNHVKKLLSKLDAKNRTEAAAIAKKLGIL